MASECQAQMNTVIVSFKSDAEADIPCCSFCVLMMCWRRCSLSAVMAVVRSSSMVVVCLIEPLMERMSSGLCSTSLTPFLPRFHFSVCGFMMYCRSEMNKSVLSASPWLVSRLRWKCFAFDVGVCAVARCMLPWTFVSNCMHGSSMPCSRKAFDTLFCSSVSNAFLQSVTATRECLVPLSGSLSELLEREISGLSWSNPV